VSNSDRNDAPTLTDAERAALDAQVAGLELVTFYVEHFALADMPPEPASEREAWERLEAMAVRWRESENHRDTLDPELWAPGLVDVLAAIEDSLVITLLDPLGGDAVIGVDEVAERVDLPGDEDAPDE